MEHGAALLGSLFLARCQTTPSNASWCSTRSPFGPCRFQDNLNHLMKYDMPSPVGSPYHICNGPGRILAPRFCGLAVKEAPFSIFTFQLFAIRGLPAVAADLGANTVTNKLLCDEECLGKLDGLETQETKSGLRYKDIIVGKGPAPPTGYQARCHPLWSPSCCMQHPCILTRITFRALPCLLSLKVEFRAGAQCEHWC